VIARLFSGLVRRIRLQWLKCRGVKILGPCWIRSIEIPHNWNDIELHPGVALDRGVTLLSTGEKSESRRISIGESTYINRHTMLDASERIEIGKNCMIGPYCYITDHDHGTKLGKLVQDQAFRSKAVLIEDGAWIGAHVTILKGVTIGQGAIIGAGTVVTKSIAANQLAAGVPAKIMGERSESIDE